MKPYLLQTIKYLFLLSICNCAYGIDNSIYLDEVILFEPKRDVIQENIVYQKYDGCIPAIVYLKDIRSENHLNILRSSECGVILLDSPKFIGRWNPEPKTE